MPIAPRTTVVIILFFLLVIGASAARAELRADELALVVNRNMPEGVALARFYAEKRGVPDGRIIELDLPTTDQMSFDAYERNVVPAIRNVLRNQRLDKQVRCLVTFYGVPLRVEARSNTPEDAKELKAIQFEQADVLKQLKSAVAELEKLATSVEPAYKAGVGLTSEKLAEQADAAVKVLQQHGSKVPQGAELKKLDDAFYASMVKLVGPAKLPPKVGVGAAPVDPATRRDATVRLLQEIQTLEEARFDPASRATLRKQVLDNLGLFAAVKVMAAQVDYFQTSVPAGPVPQTTSAALDSELSMLWIPTYTRLGWLNNPLFYAVPNGPKPPVLMVTRLDAATPDVVKKMIEDSIRVEQTGLVGTFAIDARGMTGKNDSPPMVDYDQKTRDLATFTQAKGTLPVTFDDAPGLIARNSLKDIALYTGWYSVRQYVSPGAFAPGAVGFHTASFELLSLRNANEHGWVRGLTDAGVVASVGPVAEPYLHAFPRPDDFFPLLMTGRLTFAETYWNTTPLCSWMMSAVGDPLYRPFAVKPALKVEDLPDRLKVVFEAKR